MELDFIGGFDSLKKERPLIHCITSPIAINDCANAVLAVGASPIMAEHPKEVAEIVRRAKGLSVSLANITDVRAESMGIALEAARESSVKSVIDLVGITCSQFRKELALSYINSYHPDIIKGNASEIRTLLGDGKVEAVGVDVAEKDRITADDDTRLKDMGEAVKQLAIRYGCVVLATGAVDLVSDGQVVYGLCNGTERLASITGTGCILTCLTACYLSQVKPLYAAMLATSVLNISAQLAEEEYMLMAGNTAESITDSITKTYDGTEVRIGQGSFKTALFDQLSLITSKGMGEAVKIKEI